MAVNPNLIASSNKSPKAWNLKEKKNQEIKKMKKEKKGLLL